MSEAIDKDDMEAYTKLTDNVFQQILYSSEPELEPARAILQMIQKRQLYKCIGQARIDEGLYKKVHCIHFTIQYQLHKDMQSKCILQW